MTKSIDIPMKKPTPISERLLIICVIPLLGVLLGGIYSLPAMRVTRERDPWLTLLLSCGLAITVFGLGLLSGTPTWTLGLVYGASILLLLVARRLYGSLGHNVERFGLVHMATLMILTATIVYHDITEKTAQRQLPHHTTPSSP